MPVLSGVLDAWRLRAPLNERTGDLRILGNPRRQFEYRSITKTPAKAEVFIMVHPARFELATTWFEAKYSNPLSYGCVYLAIISEATPVGYKNTILFLRPQVLKAHSTLSEVACTT